MTRHTRIAGLAAAGVPWLVSAAALIYAAAIRRPSPIARRHRHDAARALHDLHHAVAAARQETADLRAAIDEWSRVASDRVAAMEARVQDGLAALHRIPTPLAEPPPVAVAQPDETPAVQPHTAATVKPAPARRPPAGIFRAFE